MHSEMWIMQRRKLHELPHQDGLDSDDAVNIII